MIIPEPNMEHFRLRMLSLYFDLKEKEEERNRKVWNNFWSQKCCIPSTVGACVSECKENCEKEQCTLHQRLRRTMRLKKAFKFKRKEQETNLLHAIHFNMPSLNFQNDLFIVPFYRWGNYRSSQLFKWWSRDS